MEYDYIECGDCLKLMKEIPDRSVDVCFTSPPYNDNGTKNQSMHDYGGLNHRKYIHVEYREDWFDWQCQIIDEMLRISKKYVLYNVQGIKSNRKNVYELIGKYADRIHDIVIWNKVSGTPTGTPHKLSNAYEFLIIIKCDGVKGVDVNSTFYRNVITIGTKPKNQYSKIHKAVMNKDFCDEVIKEFTCEGDVVLDPFLGTGTTAVSCVEQGRHYIGFELAQEYFDCACERLDEVEGLVGIS